jgi:hypothetical protein
MGRRGLPAGEGLLLTPAPSIHTAFMRFPIDVLFLDRDLQVLKIVEQLPPWRMASKRRARSVLELTAGECARRGVAVGDRLDLRTHGADDHTGQTRLGDLPARAAGYEDMSAAEAAPASAAEAAPALDRQGGAGVPSEPLHVVVVSADPHFRTAMSILLARRNCSVMATADPARITELIVPETTDVVLIDESHEPDAAALAVVEARRQPVGVVLIADEAPTGTPDPPVLPKWGSFGDLLAAIERAGAQRESWVAHR